MGCRKLGEVESLYLSHPVRKRGEPRAYERRSVKKFRFGNDHSGQMRDKKNRTARNIPTRPTFSYIRPGLLTPPQRSLDNLRIKFGPPIGPPAIRRNSRSLKLGAVIHFRALKTCNHSLCEFVAFWYVLAKARNPKRLMGPYKQEVRS